MKKIANFIGFGTIATVLFAFLFYVINALVNLGGVFDAFSVNAGAATVNLISWITCAAIAALLMVFLVMQLIKMLGIFSKKEVENKSMLQVSAIALFGNALFVFSFFFTFIICAIYGVNPGGDAIVAFIFVLSGAAAVLVAFLVKNLAPMVKIILVEASLFLLLVVVFMLFSSGGLFLVFLIFLMLGIFGAGGYLVLANLDAFKK